MKILFLQQKSRYRLYLTRLNQWFTTASTSQLPELSSTRLKTPSGKTESSRSSAHRRCCWLETKRQTPNSCWSTGCQPTHHELGFHPLTLFSLHLLWSIWRIFSSLRIVLWKIQILGRIKCGMRLSWTAFPVICSPVFRKSPLRMKFVETLQITKKSLVCGYIHISYQVTSSWPWLIQIIGLTRGREKDNRESSFYKGDDSRGGTAVTVIIYSVAWRSVDQMRN